MLPEISSANLKKVSLLNIYNFEIYCMISLIHFTSIIALIRDSQNIDNFEIYCLVRWFILTPSYNKRFWHGDKISKSLRRIYFWFSSWLTHNYHLKIFTLVLDRSLEWKIKKNSLQIKLIYKKLITVPSSLISMYWLI